MPPRRRNKDEEADSEEEELQALPSDEEEEEEEYVTLPRPRQLLCFWDCATGSRWSARLVIVGCLEFVLKAAPDLNPFETLAACQTGCRSCCGHRALCDRRSSDRYADPCSCAGMKTLS